MEDGGLDPAKLTRPSCGCYLGFGDGDDWSEKVASYFGLSGNSKSISGGLCMWVGRGRAVSMGDSGLDLAKLTRLSDGGGFLGFGDGDWFWNFVMGDN
jgi:hypothetical protein